MIALTGKTFRRRMICLATAHAPAGGITIGGKKFKGGQFISDEHLAKATPEQKAKLEYRKDLFDEPENKSEKSPEVVLPSGNKESKIEALGEEGTAGNAANVPATETPGKGGASMDQSNTSPTITQDATIPVLPRNRIRRPGHPIQDFTRAAMRIGDIFRGDDGMYVVTATNRFYASRDLVDESPDRFSEGKGHYTKYTAIPVEESATEERDRLKAEAKKQSAAKAGEAAGIRVTDPFEVQMAAWQDWFKKPETHTALTSALAKVLPADLVDKGVEYVGKLIAESSITGKQVAYPPSYLDPQKWASILKLRIDKIRKIRQ